MRLQWDIPLTLGKAHPVTWRCANASSDIRWVGFWWHHQGWKRRKAWPLHWTSDLLLVWLFQLWALNTVIIPVYFVTINHKFGQCLGTYEAPSRLIECLTRIRRYPDHMLKKQLHAFFGGIILMSIMLVAKEMPNTWQISTPDYLDKNMKSSTNQQLTIVDPLFTHLWFIRFPIQSYSTHNPCTTEAEKRCRPPALDRYDFEPRRLSSPDLQFLSLLSS